LTPPSLPHTLSNSSASPFSGLLLLLLLLLLFPQLTVFLLPSCSSPPPPPPLLAHPLSPPLSSFILHPASCLLIHQLLSLSPRGNQDTESKQQPSFFRSLSNTCNQHQRHALTASVHASPQVVRRGVRCPGRLAHLPIAANRNRGLGIIFSS